MIHHTYWTSTLSGTYMFKDEIREKLKGNRAALEALGLEPKLPTKPHAVLRATYLSRRSTYHRNASGSWVDAHGCYNSGREFTDVEVLFPGVDND